MSQPISSALRKLALAAVVCATWITTAQATTYVPVRSWTIGFPGFRIGIEDYANCPTPYEVVVHYGFSCFSVNLPFWVVVSIAGAGLGLGIVGTFFITSRFADRRRDPGAG